MDSSNLTESGSARIGAGTSVANADLPVIRRMIATLAQTDGLHGGDSGERTKDCKWLKIWWTWSGSNRRPLPCHGSALPAAPQAHLVERRNFPQANFHPLEGDSQTQQPQATIYSFRRILLKRRKLVFCSGIPKHLDEKKLCVSPVRFFGADVCTSDGPGQRHQPASIAGTCTVRICEPTQYAAFGPRAGIASGAG